MRKKGLLKLSIIGTLVIFLTVLLDQINSCYYNLHCVFFSDFLDNYFFVFLIFPLIVLFFLVTYKMHEEIFNAWHKFSMWYLIIYVILSVYLSVEASKMGGGLSGVVGGGFIVIIIGFSLIVFFFVSLIIITNKYFSLKKSNKA